jgi:hypothetical protein
VEPKRFEDKVFPAPIQEISPSFVSIFNQASAAESMQLDQVCGCGYRRALEFLVKDYACSLVEDAAKKDAIGSDFLGRVIGDYIDDPRVKLVASRAAWLGNDETHYVRKWTEMDLEDLKTLIQLSVNWIESVKLTEKYGKEMPSGKS